MQHSCFQHHHSLYLSENWTTEGIAPKHLIVTQNYCSCFKSRLIQGGAEWWSHYKNFKSHIVKSFKLYFSPASQRCLWLSFTQESPQPHKETSFLLVSFLLWDLGILFSFKISVCSMSTIGHETIFDDLKWILIFPFFDIFTWEERSG